MIRFACPQCQKGFEVEDKFAGSKTKCPNCHGPILIPPLPVAAALPSAPPIEDVFGMAELLDEAEQEAARKQQRQVASEPMEPSRLVPCVDCEQPISRLASICPNCGRPLSTKSRPDKHPTAAWGELWKGASPFGTKSGPDKYPALRFIAGLNKFFAIVVPIVCLVGLVAITKAEVVTPETIVPLVVYMIAAPLALWGSAELILLLIDIESNTSILRGAEEREQ